MAVGDTSPLATTVNVLVVLISRVLVAVMVVVLTSRSVSVLVLVDVVKMVVVS